jgi:hypothetical protein
MALTITDEQIRQLWRDGRITRITLDEALPVNTRAVCLDRGYAVTPHMRERARAFCAEILARGYR